MSSFKKLKKYAIILKEVKNQRGRLAMVKIDLITGFLGSGKTTFIKKYAKYLLDKGMNIGILENDFGAVNAEYEKFFKENNHPNFPARSCVEVARLPKDVGLEIEAIAVRK